MARMKAPRRRPQVGSTDDRDGQDATPGARRAGWLARQLIRLGVLAAGEGPAARTLLLDEARRASGGALGPIALRRGDVLLDCGDMLMWRPVLGTEAGADLAAEARTEGRALEAVIAALTAEGRWRGGVIVELGARFGAQTLHAALREDVDRVIALEPEPAYAEYLRRNIALNRLEEVALALQIAASDRSGPAPPEIGAQMSAPAEPRTERSRTAAPPGLAAARLDDILGQNRIRPGEVGLVSMDVEGHEVEVFSGMPSLLSARTPVCFHLRAGPPDAARLARWQALIAPHYTTGREIAGGRAAPLPLTGVFAAGPGLRLIL